MVQVASRAPHRTASHTMALAMSSLSRPAPRKAFGSSRRHAAPRLACHASKYPLQALLFDCDGVLVDTEKDGHRVSFNEAFKRKGAAQGCCCLARRLACAGAEGAEGCAGPQAWSTTCGTLSCTATCSRSAAAR